MKRRILLTIAAILVITLALAGCGGEAEAPNTENNDLGVSFAGASTEEIAAYLQENLEFEDIMQNLDSDIALSLYNLTDEQVSDCYMIGSTGATAEEIVVFAVNDGQEEAVVNACNERVSAQIASFENYVPKELEKLAEPVIVSADDVVVMVVCDDTAKAQELINNFGK